MAKMTCQNALPTDSSNGKRASCRGESLSVMSRKPTMMDVSNAESESNKPTTPTIPIVNARPCKNVLEVAPQMRLSARSTTANTQEPAHSTSTTHVTIAPKPRSFDALIVSRRN